MTDAEGVAGRVPQGANARLVNVSILTGWTLKPGSCGRIRRQISHWRGMQRMPIVMPSILQGTLTGICRQSMNFGPSFGVVLRHSLEVAATYRRAVVWRGRAGMSRVTDVCTWLAPEKGEHTGLMGLWADVVDTGRPLFWRTTSTTGGAYTLAPVAWTPAPAVPLARSGVFASLTAYGGVGGCCWKGVSRDVPPLNRSDGWEVRPPTRLTLPHRLAPTGPGRR